jgi:hypothetical protein
MNIQAEDIVMLDNSKAVGIVVDVSSYCMKIHFTDNKLIDIAPPGNVKKIYYK